MRYKLSADAMSHAPSLILLPQHPPHQNSKTPVAWKQLDGYPAESPYAGTRLGSPYALLDSAFLRAFTINIGVKTPNTVSRLAPGSRSTLHR
ncbi:hypothetical protein GE061_009981 [Apolygus lucorum]|uniref:Uncharacterized protein n=1 Tax=Apolygus lucorum TaxID=248454 RepID=A0A8S9Y3B4_APOLU|nr:hypothetical protein GE061_009981 [Apolygus lucorum]